MPKSAEAYARVIDTLIGKCTPRKRKALSQLNDQPRKRRALFQLNDQPSKRLCVTKAEISATHGYTVAKQAIYSVAQILVKRARKTVVCKAFGISKNVDFSKLKYKARGSAALQSKVRKFYKREDISRTLPMKRYATKHGACQLMQCSLLSAHSKFSSENTDLLLSYSTFAKLRPDNVKLMSTKYRQNCECVYCVNIRYKLATLSNLVDNEKKQSHESDLMDMTLCNKTDKFHNVKCVAKQCNTCKDYETSLRQYYNFTADQLCTDITWHSWRRVKNERDKVQRKLITQTEPLSTLMAEFVEDMISPTKQNNFFEHLFVAYWQFHMYTMIKNNLPNGYILQVIDFAKNRSTMYETEVKSSFFNPTQITMHPIITFYNGPKGLIRHSITILSNDHVHDVHAVEHYVNLSLGKIKQAMPEKFTTQVVFSDGCAAQYKCGKSFGDIGTKHHNIIRCWFGSEHGKGESDGETGIINRELDNAICGRRVIINSAKDAFDYCNGNFTLDKEFSKREFIYVNEGDINRDRSYIDVKTVPQTRQIHQVTNSSVPYIINKRRLSCFCPGCLTSDEASCANSDIVEPLERYTLILNQAVKLVPELEATPLVDVDELLNMDIEEVPMRDEVKKYVYS